MGGDTTVRLKRAKMLALPVESGRLFRIRGENAVIVEDAIAHCDDAGGDCEAGEVIQWHAVGKSPSSGVAPKTPNIGLDSKVIQGFFDSYRRYSEATASVAQVCENYSKLLPSADVVRDAVSAVSSYAVSLPDFSLMFQNVCLSLQQFANASRKLALEVDLGGVFDSLRPIALKAKRIELLGKANWPMYLIDDAEVCNELDMLPAHVDDEELRELVADIACRSLGGEWLEATRSRWKDHPELSPGESGVLMRALNRHENCDYEGCVALLMNLFEGLIGKYCPPELKRLEGERAELFDLYAENLGVNSSHKKNGEARELTNVKDKVLIMILLSENGWYAFRHAADYIVKVILTNAMTDDLAAHNPLRNKICHGAQTEYGTVEHSLKAILVTDIVIRFGAVIFVGKAKEARDGDPQGV